ncbi:MAG: DNA polymerase III subunit gamma/tau [Bacteroidetes bacterium]|nr:DNA polymerase III subunit gamma/tau [Bacteroidota bacterium]
MSKFVVSARKYRPFRFTDVVGQEHVTKTLKNALNQDKLAHAFLFCGPRGVGKTTCARILAKVLNCKNVTEDHEPCNQCDSCLSFNENSSFNITELDAASNNSVEHIRALIEQVRFQPQQGRYKIFIIDEVHMLSQQAFNAFLKTLEEPPSYAIFILATTEKHKIIPTILSRCQIFDFRRIQIPDTVQHLQQICTKEEIQADKEALHIIAQKADGALRDALSIFDRIVSFSGKSISYEDVITNLNVLDYDYYFRLVDALLVEDISTVLLLFDEVLRNGFEPDLFINGLAEHMRNLLVCKDEQTLQLLEVSESLKNRYRQQASLTPAGFLITALNLINECDFNYKMARNKRLHTEMAIIKMTHINRMIQVDPLQTKKFQEKKTYPISKQVSEPIETPIIKQPPTKTIIEKKEVPPQEEKNEKAKIEFISNPDPDKVEESEPPKIQLLKDVKGNKHQTPTLKGLDALVNEIRENEKDVVQARDDMLSDTNLKTAWNQYVEKHTNNSAKSMFQHAEIQLKEKVVIATVGSVLAQNTLRQESRLIEALRKQLHTPDLVMDVQVDKKKALSNALPKRKKPLNNNDKYKILLEENPLIGEMQKRFDLRFDEE